MKIWKRDITIAALNAGTKDTLMETLGMSVTQMGDDFIEVTMPVDHRTHQPYGLLHGGASVALAESLGSLASMLALAPEDDRWCVGIEINANHIRSVTSGTVVGTVKPIHVGNSLHVWEIQIVDERKKLVCISRLTVSVVPKR